jgi:hypothetical protein
MKFGVLKSLVLLATTATLVACGGGGGSGNDSGFNPPGVNITASQNSVALNTRSATSIVVRMAQAGGAPVADGTRISGTLSGAGLGNLAALGSLGNGATASGTTVGGAVTFVFQTGATAGTGSITFSGQDPVTPARNVSATVNVTVSTGPGSDPRIAFQAEKTQLPINALNVPFFLGSPFISEVVVTIRSATGQAINDDREGDQAVQFSIDPVELGAVSILDDPETAQINELTTPWGAIFSGVTAGTARAFVWSDTQPGTLTLRAAFTDPDTGQRVEGIYPFQIVSQIPPLPASISISGPSSPVYVTNSGGTSTGPLEIFVADGNGAPVPNPVAGNNAFNNVRLEILQVDGGDARVSATNAAGANQDGATIVTRTTDGIANALVRAGLRTGTYTLRATTDRADNNVDNGVTDPIVADRAIVISDGRLFNVEITQPIANALTINPVSPTATPTPGQIPNSPDGTYSLTVAVIATDRLGNPVLPGTSIKFGLIDEPQVTGLGDFQIAGGDGNPQEGGTLFTAVGGQFRTAGGGAGPGDALVIFGKEVDGNRDLEGARVVSTVNSQTSLTVQRRFNRNDDTGSSVDYLGVLPYVIGRALEGNIVAEGLTNEFGVARTTMTYPVSRLGKRVIVWAQGEADIINNIPETASDVDVLAFAGSAPLQLTASPSSIPANTTSSVTVCVADRLGTPLRGVPIGFNFLAFQGNGTVDGTANGGTLANPTGPDGCTVATVVTSGVPEDGGSIEFSAGGATDEVEIVRGDLILQAQPTATFDPVTIVTLTLINGLGAPQAGYLILGECTGTNGTRITLSNGPGITNAQGQTTVQINAENLDQINQVGGGSCDFETVDGTASATVDIIGRDLCTLDFSPPPTGCTPPVTFTLSVTLSSLGTGNGFTVNSLPPGISCTIGNEEELLCIGAFEEDEVVALGATGTGGSTGVYWSGECAPTGGGGGSQTPSNGATVTMTGGDKVCSVSSTPPPP